MTSEKKHEKVSKSYLTQVKYILCVLQTFKTSDTDLED